MGAAEKTVAPLPAKLAGLLREAKWLVLVALAVYLVLIFATFNRADPGWSHSATDAVARNAGGLVGAWLADLLLYLFGISAYWWVALCVYIVVWGYRRLDGSALIDRRPLALAFTGFVLLLVSSAALERLRLHSLPVELPLAPGGLLGEAMGGLVAGALGFTGATLLLLTIAAVGFSLFTGISWLAVSEAVGHALEAAFGAARQAWERRRDRKLGELAREERDFTVGMEKLREEEHPPLRIEPPVLEIKKSERVQKEKQAPLFDELPDTPLPPLKLLDEAKHEGDLVSAETLEFTSRLIEKKLSDFGVVVKVLAAYPGPVITRYEVEPAVGVKGSQIVNLVKDLARALSVVSIRVVETIPGKSCMGLEIPNPHRQTVRLTEILGSEAYHALHSPLALALGKDISGNPVVADLARMPHLLVAGTTGSGKSVALNAMILSLLYKSELRHVRLILVDPKMLELSVYHDIPHLLAPVVTDMKQATNALGWCVAEMDRRYRLMNWLGVRNLSCFNHKVAEAEKQGRKLEDPFTVDAAELQPLKPLPHIVVVIDELADLMMVVGKKVEELIARLAQKARAAGIHLILATQRPSVDVITGLIKANIPARIAFQVSSKVDSRTILDQSGAEALLGSGDMLYLPPGTGLPQRVHGAFVADHEVHRVVEHLKGLAAPDYLGAVLEPAAQEESGNGAGAGEPSGEKDPLYDQAVEIVLRTRRPSISLVQRHLRIGYNRAARLIEDMERAGMVSPMQSNGNREVLVPAKAE
ncbi:MAG: cell division protein FtsK [Betaproteobacteria bacterium RIFCSPLOWO2_12_FULL_65_14]|nr:MAG: cell division protein FtsK [Betaproteobacteria bacterium RIFCSPLOWO2_12_FULL_65_14]